VIRHFTLRRGALVAVLTLVAASSLGGTAAAKGTPSNVTVTCGASTVSATVTVQLMSGVTSPSPASNQIVLRCTASAPVATAKISPFSQPAAAYAWSAFVTATSSTFGCGGTTARGKTATCVNAAGGPGSVTVLAS
jgi:hypothetical protein